MLATKVFADSGFQSTVALSSIAPSAFQDMPEQNDFVLPGIPKALMHRALTPCKRPDPFATSALQQSKPCTVQMHNALELVESENGQNPSSFPHANIRNVEKERVSVLPSTRNLENVGYLMRESIQTTEMIHSKS